MSINRHCYYQHDNKRNLFLMASVIGEKMGFLPQKNRHVTGWWVLHVSTVRERGLSLRGGQRKPGAVARLYYPVRRKPRPSWRGGCQAASLLTQVSLLENGRTWLDSWKSKESCCI